MEIRLLFTLGSSNNTLALAGGSARSDILPLRDAVTHGHVKPAYYHAFRNGAAEFRPPVLMRMTAKWQTIQKFPGVGINVPSLPCCVRGFA
jgi:hypothetical protein